MSVRGSSSGIAVAAALVLLGSAGPAAAQTCTSKASIVVTDISPLRYSFDYRACNVADIDQVRDTAGSFIGLPNDGVLYCVPTSAIDWMVHLVKKGFVSKPADKDWTNPANFNEMSAVVQELAGYMGTDPFGGTVPETKALDGIDEWLDRYGVSKITDLGATTTEKLFVSGGLYSADPAAMAAAAAGGALVMPGVSFFDSSGTQQGGHYVALKEASGNNERGLITLGVRDPFTDKTRDTVQSAYATDVWSVSPQRVVGRGYPVSGIPYEADLGFDIYFGGYLTIEPKKIVTVVGHTFVYDPPLNLFTGRPTPIRRFASPGKREILDVALAPDGLMHPFLMRGSDAVWRLNPVTGTSTRFADGPRRPSHLTFGGPRMALFVAGDRQLVALDRAGRRLGARTLSHPLDSLAFNQRTRQLVGLSTAARRIELFTPQLRPLGGLRLPSSFAAARGRPSLAVTREGRLLIHRDGSRTVSTVEADEQAHASHAFPQAAVRNRTLRGAKRPQGLAVDDDGRMFVTAAGRLVELTADGARVRNSAYSGLRAGGIVRVDRNFSNLPPGAPPLDYLSPELQAALFNAR